MSEQAARRVSRWLKGTGAALVATAGVFAATAADGGFGTSREVRRLVFSLSGGIAGIGWIFLALGMSWHPHTQIAWRSGAVWLLVALLAACSAAAFWFRLGELGVPAALNGGIVVCWVLLAAVGAVARKGAAVEVSQRDLAMGLGAAAAMSTGSLLLHPWERSACVTEGPGQLVVLAGWILLVAV